MTVTTLTITTILPAYIFKLSLVRLVLRKTFHKRCCHRLFLMRDVHPTNSIKAPTDIIDKPQCVAEDD